MTWAADKKWFVAACLSLLGSLAAWGGSKVAESYDIRGERLTDLEKRQSVNETKADSDRELLREVREDVKKILHHVTDGGRGPR